MWGVITHYTPIDFELWDSPPSCFIVACLLLFLSI
nr:MAG TPA: hypothetical protein [Crassvirales sp.]